MKEKDKYREFCRKEPSMPVFSRDWWMDAVCGEESWEALVVEKGGEIVASMPCYIKRKFGLKVIVQPLLTQKNGIWIKYPEGQSYNKRLSFEKEVMDEIIRDIKSLKVCYFNQSFDYTITNWLPFYWRGFEQTTKYTYVIEDLSNLDEVFEGFDYSKRRDIEKAEGLISIRKGLPAEEFYENHKMTLAKQKKDISYSWSLFSRIYNAAIANNAGEIIYATDAQENIHAAFFLVWDDESTYGLISSIDPDFRKSGASALLHKETIRLASTRTQKFDFEGSMIESVESSNRKFGAVQKPYSNITREYNAGVGIGIRWATYKMLSGFKHLINSS